MKLYKGYEAVIGLEVHAELQTETKIFCSCPTAFGAEPNSQCCPVCMGMPGTLPVLNRAAVDLAVKAGLVTNCKIENISRFDRKHYFYPDLPKAYQITQYFHPLCKNGKLAIETESGIKEIGITRIHMEEDAGKLIHDDLHGTMIDCNRCGVPLIEIVSEPELRSGTEAVAYVRKLRQLLLYADVSDGRMQEGSLRCDVNLSVRKAGEPSFGVRTEMKNLNSFTSIQKAIEYEYRRQVDALENGEQILQETRRFDPKSGKTVSMRRKENANDYRYLPEPDLPQLVLSETHIRALQSQLPMLPDDRKLRYIARYGLSDYDCEQLLLSRYLAEYFETCAELTAYPKLLANLLIGEIFRILPADMTENDFSAPHAFLAAVAEMAGNGIINSGTAKKLAVEVWENGIDPIHAVKTRNLAQICDEKQLDEWITETFLSLETLVNDYRNGKEKAAKALFGDAMARSAGKANPVLLQNLLMKRLKAL